MASHQWSAKHNCKAIDFYRMNYAGTIKDNSYRPWSAIEFNGKKRDMNKESHRNMNIKPETNKNQKKIRDRETPKEPRNTKTNQRFKIELRTIETELY